MANGLGEALSVGENAEEVVVPLIVRRDRIQFPAS